MGNYYSYKRISTDIERQNFTRQIKSLERYAKDHDIEYLIDFTEEKSAKNFTDRPQFKKLDKLLQAGDTVVFKDDCVIIEPTQKDLENQGFVAGSICF